MGSTSGGSKMAKHMENYCFGFLGGILEVFCASNGILLQGWIILRLRLAFRLLFACLRLAFSLLPVRAQLSFSKFCSLCELALRFPRFPFLCCPGLGGTPGGRKS